jgi:hypothetical protein
MSDVGHTIFQQMGGAGRLRAMIGAKDFGVGENVAQFKWAAKARNGANSIRIVLDPSDTYTMEFYKIRAGNAKLVKSFSDVYADSLKRIFESETGLYLSL